MAAIVAQDAAGVGLVLRLLGPPRLVLSAGVAHPLERKDAALLALLALEGATSRAKMAALLWPDISDEQARSSLRQRLFRLRRIAGRDVVVGDDSVRLAADVSVDLAQLEQELAADPHAGRGELLGSHDYSDSEPLEQWVLGARERWRERRTSLLAKCASELERRQQIAAALPYAQRMVADDAVLEHAHRRLMRLHYLRGDRAAALLTYERCRDTLQRELGARPGHETAQLARLIEASGTLPQAAPAPRPIATLRPPRLVGREAEWRELQRARQDGQAAVVLGEPGIGKTRLLGDFAAAHDAPMFGARPGDARVPYALLARLVRELARRFGPPAEEWVAAELARIAPELGAAATSKLEVLRLQQAVAAALAQWRAAGLALAVIDDLQFADEATLEMLPGLVASAHESGSIVWLLGVRANDVPAIVAAWLGASDGGSARRVAIGPLDPGGIEALLDSLAIAGLDAARWAPPLARHTGGNPMFVLETLIALLDRDAGALAGAPLELPSPGHVGELIQRRLEQLSLAALKLARLAAIAGPDFSIDLASAVLGQHALDIADTWRELEAALVLRDNAFAHDLIYEATLRAVPKAIAKALHRDIAARLQSCATPAARVAAHWDAAGEWDAAAASFESAAQQARAQSARREELHALDAAARCHRAAAQPTSEAAAFDCEWRGVRLLIELQSADAALARARDLLQRGGTERQRAAAFEALSQVLNERYESEPALAAARSAQALAAAASDPRLALLASQRAAMALVRLARPVEAVAALHDGADQLHRLHAEERLFWLSDRAAVLDYADRRSEAVRMFNRTIEEAERLGHWSAAGDAWSGKGIALMHLGRLAASLHAAQRGQECGRLAGADGTSLLIDEMNFVGALRDSGRFAEYLQRAEPLPQALREAGYAVWAINAENDLAVSFAWLGRPQQARQALSPLPAELPPMMRAARLFVQARLSRGYGISLGTARPAELVRQACALIESGSDGGRSYVRLRIALELARDEEPAVALARVEAIEADAVRLEQVMLASHARLLRVELLLGSGESAAAAAAARELLAGIARDGPVPGLYAPEPWWLAHQALAAVAADDAAAPLREALHWIEQTALPQLPDVFRSSFLERNAINRSVLAAAARHGLR